MRYVPPSTTTEEPGFFARMFSSKPQAQGLTRYQIQLQAQADGGTRVRVLNQAAQPETSDNAEKILKLLAAEMR